ncbi:unnamed protein product [Didymodactylos carnosus]|uniref:RBR-type E3 ubiquitin transferase n=1 Tax=Didymodactylos carnosus TaxID=1234261 RepID=A0A814WDM9_9BILA|nr:unnamed protein product [Didymodactylos carnosus]CAF1199986.1 unnamed protein product [Didymodactylos carnosus]CAF3768529.1 unnamed protein product [Didymodactylos carnosus]CAF3964561.1 unnamed protein product [Didymodactylos carnosus]
MCNDDGKCPEIDCKIKFGYHTIKYVLQHNHNKEVFDRYDRFYTQQKLEEMYEFIWCAHRCGSGQLNEGQEILNIMTCVKCHRKTCFEHKVEWHEGLTCAQYDEQTNVSVRLTKQWITQNTKSCPGCSAQIEKDAGCDHMTCIKCKHEFCWACLANYNRIRRDGNHRHDQNCKHYSAYNS